MDVKIDLFTDEPVNVSDSVMEGTRTIQVPVSFLATKTISENVEKAKFSDVGKRLFKGYIDGNNVVHPKELPGTTFIEFTKDTVDRGIDFEPVTESIVENVEITSKDRIRDFTIPEILQAKATGYLLENPNFDNVFLENLDTPLTVFDTVNSANFIVDKFRVVIHPLSTVQTLPVSLGSVATTVLLIPNFEGGTPQFEVSTNNGVNFEIVDQLVPITLANPGSDLIFKITNTTSGQRLTVKSLVLLFK